ncbi:MAG: hypothetical protein LKE85_17160 [Lachnospiraceae bacterium]|nr:hypothetical protein [Lachnospiraceae bacterium]
MGIIKRTPNQRAVHRTCGVPTGGPQIWGKEKNMFGFLIFILIGVLLFRFTGFLLGILGRVFGGVLGLIGFLVLGILAVTILGIGFFVLPILLVAGIIAIAVGVAK